MESSCAADQDGSVANTKEKAQIECQVALALKGLTERRLTDVALCGGRHPSQREEMAGRSLKGFTLCNPVSSVVKILGFPDVTSR
jgi:hypothetical protein